MVRLGAPVEHLLHSAPFAVIILVAHRIGTHVESQTDGLRGVLHVAAALHNILRGDLEGRGAVFLLEGACEVALMVVLPLE